MPHYYSTRPHSYASKKLHKINKFIVNNIRVDAKIKLEIKFLIHNVNNHLGKEYIMGLIQAALSSATGAIAEQWKEYFYCDALPANVIAVKAHKKVKGLSSNHGDDNIISDGSVIAVADGQCMLIVEQGKVVDICAEPGEYVYDSATEPSVFTGELGDAVKIVFEQIGKRFQFGGQPAEDQRIYYFNTKELIGNKYGTPNPIPFRLVDQRSNIDLDIGIRCFGEYSLKVVDPILFYTNVCGNFENVYSVEHIADQLKSELLSALQPAFANISAKGLRYSEIPAHTKELAELLNTELSKEWGEKRGIEISSIGISSISATEEDEERIKQMQITASLANPEIAAAHLVNAQAQAMQDAAKNEGGAALGFMNMGLAQQAGGASPDALFAMGKENAPAGNEWVCPKCGAKNTTNFCGTCGEQRPGAAKWICPDCKTENTGNFCTTCGKAKPE